MENEKPYWMNLTGGTNFSGELRFVLENHFPEAHYKKAIDKAFQEEARSQLRTDGGSRTQYFWSGEDGIVFHTEIGEDMVDPFFGSVEEAERYLERQADKHGKQRYEGLVLRKSGNQKVKESTEVLTEQEALDFFTDGGLDWKDVSHEYWTDLKEFEGRHSPRYVDPGRPVDHDTVDYFPHRHFQQGIREAVDTDEDYRDVMDAVRFQEYGVDAVLD